MSVPPSRIGRGRGWAGSRRVCECVHAQNDKSTRRRRLDIASGGRRDMRAWRTGRTRASPTQPPCLVEYATFKQKETPDSCPTAPQDWRTSAHRGAQKAKSQAQAANGAPGLYTLCLWPGPRSRRPSAIVSGSQHLPEGGLPRRRGTDAPPRLWIGVLRGREVSGSTRGAGTAVTAGGVPQLKVVSGRHSNTRKRPFRSGVAQAGTPWLTRTKALQYHPDPPVRLRAK